MITTNMSNASLMTSVSTSALQKSMGTSEALVGQLLESNAAATQQTQPVEQNSQTSSSSNGLDFYA